VIWQVKMIIATMRQVAREKSVMDPLTLPVRYRAPPPKAER